MSIKWTAHITCDSPQCGRMPRTHPVTLELTHEREIAIVMPDGWVLHALGSGDDSQRDVNHVDPMGDQLSAFCPDHA